MADKEVRPDGEEKVDLADQAVTFIEKLMTVHRDQAVPPELHALEGFDRLCEYIRSVKKTLFEFSRGHFEIQPNQGGAAIGYIKALQSNIRHLAWQCRCVANGDIQQRVDFMGELSEAFNLMTENLVEKQRIIERKQKELTALTKKLRQEIRLKEEIETVLRVSEEAYRQKSLRDHLTGLYNRGYFFEAVTREMEDLKRRPDKSFCLVMADIDKFKDYNDTYGHLQGDQAIKTVAAAASMALRKSDILARYGGEEFAVFVGESDLKNGLLIAERIRGLVEAQPNPAGTEAPPITVSLGLCCVDDQFLQSANSGAGPLISALAQADSALYEAKKRGRNQVWYSTGPTQPSFHRFPEVCRLAAN